MSDDNSGGGVKVPGVGKVKKSWVYGGGIAFVAVFGYVYYKNKKTAAASAAALASTTASTQYSDSSLGGSPDYGTNYGGEYYAGYGGIDPNTGVPYAYENYQDYGSSSSSSTITTNQAWVSQAESDAQQLYGATYSVAVDAVEKYMAQSPGGLPANEYTLMQSIVAELGTPPTGGPYRLIQASTGTTTTGGGTSLQTLTPGTVITVPFNIVSPMNMQQTASKFGISLQHLINSNPGSTSATTGQVNVPIQVQPGMTLQSIAMSFGISPEHLAQVLTGEGYV